MRDSYQTIFKILVDLKSREGNGTPLQYSCLENPMDGGAWQAAVHGVAKSRTRLSYVTFTFHFHVLEKEMATHSSVLAWRIPGMAEPGGLPSMGLHRVEMTEVTQQLNPDGYISAQRLPNQRGIFLPHHKIIDLLGFSTLYCLYCALLFFVALAAI